MVGSPVQIESYLQRVSSIAHTVVRLSWCLLIIDFNLAVRRKSTYVKQFKSKTETGKVDICLYRQGVLVEM